MQVGSRGPAPPAPRPLMHTQQAGRTQRSQGQGREGLAQSDGRAWPPSLRPRSSMPVSQPESQP